MKITQSQRRSTGGYRVSVESGTLSTQLLHFRAKLISGLDLTKSDLSLPGY